MKLVGRWGGVLKAETLGAIMLDFNQGKAHFHDIISLKLAHLWEELPWKLAILGHHNETAARWVAGQIIEKMMSSSRNPDLHHPLTLKLCWPGSLLCEQLESFSSGRSTLGKMISKV